MRRLPVEQAAVGQVLAEDVVDAEGRRVLPRGARLSAAVLSRFARWGVHEVAVEGEAAPEAAAETTGVDAADPGPLLESLAHRFEGFEADETMLRIHAVARRHLAAREGSGPAAADA